MGPGPEQGRERHLCKYSIGADVAIVSELAVCNPLTRMDWVGCWSSCGLRTEERALVIDVSGKEACCAQVVSQGNCG